MKRAFWKGLGNLTGAVPGGWTNLNIRTFICHTQTPRDKEKRVDMSRQGEDLAAWEQVNQ